MPYAFVARVKRDISVHRIPSRACDDRETPLVPGRDRNVIWLSRVVVNNNFRKSEGGTMGPLGHITHSPSVISAQRIAVLPLRNSITLGSVAAGRSWPSTAVAAIMSQRSL